jgi:hypothetical protein
MESFFALLQKNVLDTRSWASREELRMAIVVWIETKYNRRRRQRALGKLTPVELRPSTWPQTRRRNHQPRVSTKPGAVPAAQDDVAATGDILTTTLKRIRLAMRIVPVL